MAQFLQLLVNALAIGSIYAVTALSFEIAYEATGVVNFATGQLVTVGALVGASALAYTHGSFGVFYLGTLLIMAAVVALFGTVIPLHAIFIIAVTTVLIVCVYLLLNRSVLGRQFRALAQDAEAARLTGIRVGWLYCFTWVLVAALGGIAGVLLSPLWFVDVNMGDKLALKAFAAAVIGGFGSIPGAVCGGILVGAAERCRQHGWSLSGGEQQMLAVGRALMSRPKALLDEPSLGLAPLIAGEVYERLAQIGAMGVTILLVEQNTAMALSVAARAYLLEHGSIVLAGAARELTDHPRIREAYLGA